MMKNKGFTLVELLGILVILAVIGLLVSQNIISRVKENNNKLVNLSKDILVSSARDFVDNNENEFEKNVTKSYCLNYDFLIKTPYLNEGMMPQLEAVNKVKKYYVKVTYDGKNYSYNIVEGCEKNDLAPSFQILKIDSVDKTTLTLEIDILDDNLVLAQEPYSFDNGVTWQSSNRKTIDSSYNDTIVVKSFADIESKKDYSVSKLTIDANEGVWNSVNNISYMWLEKDEIRNISNPIRLQYVFTYWTVSCISCSMNGNEFKMGTDNATITANWQIKQYQLVINPNGGTWNGQTSNSIIYLSSSETQYIAPAEKAGVTFLGWESSENNNVDSSNIFTMQDKNVTLTAKWGICTGPESYTYTGNHEFIENSNGGYKIRFLSSGTYTPVCPQTIDVFLVGGGSAAGGSGYTKTVRDMEIQGNTEYYIEVGDGGTPSSVNGKQSSAFGQSISGGQGRSGGSGSGFDGYTDYGSAGGVDGSGAGGGSGQGRTTREFGEPGGKLYAGGGGGGGGWFASDPEDEYGCNDYCCYDGDRTAYCKGGSGGSGGGGQGGGCGWYWSSGGAANTGGGAGLGCRGNVINNGGSGIVIIRNIVYTGNDIYEYTGNSEFISETNGNYKIRLLSSGNLKLKKDANIDVFLVGGGSSFGGSGYTTTQKNIAITLDQIYSIVIGDGGIPGYDGSSSTAFGYTALPGNGSSGGSGAGAAGYTWAGSNGGSNGQNGGAGINGWVNGTGQGTTTREFGEANGTLYSGGGGGGGGYCGDCEEPTKTNVAVGGLGGSGGGGCADTRNNCSHNGIANTGGGAGQGIRGVGKYYGGSGIVIIRNAR